jgi:hypothetical protein
MANVSPHQRAKDDKRPKRGMWAPGAYFCKCAKCGDTFIGDKRAIWCADCAYRPINSK